MDGPAVRADRVVADIPEDISELGAAGCVEAYRQGKTLPDAVLSYCLDRIDRYNDDFRAISDLDREGAERAALESKKRWNAGASLSPLDGVPIAVKANIAVKGLPWTAGNRRLRPSYRRRRCRVRYWPSRGRRDRHRHDQHARRRARLDDRQSLVRTNAKPPSVRPYRWWIVWRIRGRRRRRILRGSARHRHDRQRPNSGLLLRRIWT